jgi:Ca2+/Na+ antiporter
MSFGDSLQFLQKGGILMIWWVFLLVVVTIMSYLSDVGILTFLQDFRVPFLNASLMSILVLLCLIGLLARMMKMSKKGEKEALREKVKQLEKELSDLKGQ